MFLFVLGLATAAPCPTAPRLDVRLSPDGSAHYLVQTIDQTCWWVVDDNGDATVGGRWQAPRRLVEVVPLPDGVTLLVVEEQTGVSLFLAYGPWRFEKLLWLPARPVSFLRHETQAIVGVRTVEPDGEHRIRLYATQSGSLLRELRVGWDTCVELSNTDSVTTTSYC